MHVYKLKWLIKIVKSPVKSQNLNFKKSSQIVWVCFCKKMSLKLPFERINGCCIFDMVWQGVPELRCCDTEWSGAISDSLRNGNFEHRLWHWPKFSAWFVLLNKIAYIWGGTVFDCLVCIEDDFVCNSRLNWEPVKFY